MVRSGGKPRVNQVGYAVVDRNQMNADPVAAQADAVLQAVQGMPLPQSVVIGGLPGQTVVIRHPRLPNMPYEEIAQSIEAEAGQNIPYDLSEVYLDWALLEGPSEGEDKQIKVLLVAARHEVVETRVQVAEAADIQYSILGVDSLALANAAEACAFFRPDETLALVNLGASSTSIHFFRDGTSSFIRELSWGAREMIQSVAKGNRCDYEEAERLLQKYAERERTSEPAGPATEAVPEAAPMPEEGRPEEDPGARNPLDPFEDELGDAGESRSASAAGPPSEGQPDVGEFLSTPLARLVVEIRRSFEYYEHQLYEKPVDRILLSGGVAHVPIIGDSMADELGVESVEVANPGESALRLGGDTSLSVFTQRPAQFMVAVGLAATGVEEL